MKLGLGQDYDQITSIRVFFTQSRSTDGLLGKYFVLGFMFGGDVGWGADEHIVLQVGVEVFETVLILRDVA